MAISKERKDEVIDQYVDWMNNSRAMVVTEYIGLSMKDLDNLRSKVREAGGEFHIVKNTLSKVAFERVGWQQGEAYFEGSTAIAFAFEDAPAMAKTIADFAKTSDFLKIKGGYLQEKMISSEDVKSLAELPPLPVMRAQVLGTIMAPASKLVRTLAEPGRMIAAVIKAYADKEGGAVETVEAAAG